ncbi:MAG: hypothetical protein JNK15_19645 [Planctomycetes bacterium]|nr:hypothetical protein [Planctomycetota bacterium]
MPRSALRLGVLLLATAPAHAQFGNEWVFVGTTGNGNYSFVDAATGTAVSGNDPRARNVRGAAFADLGQHLYVANAAPATGVTGISRAVWNGSSAAWSPFYVVPDASYFLGLDRVRQRLWVLTGNATAGRELHCVDANPASATYGQLLAQTTTLGPTFRERWALSPSGNLAAVPHGSVGENSFEIVDTDPASPTYLQIVVSVPLSTTSPGSGYIMACEVSRDDRYAYTVVPGIAPYVAVLDIATQQWLDFGAAPGQQHLMLPQLTPTYMALAPDASYLVVTGIPSGLGWVKRIDFDYQNPALSTLTDVLPSVQKFACNGPSVSFDGSRFAFVANGGLYVVDAASGSQLTFAPATGGLFTAWQDLRPTATYASYGAGCPGSAGTPTLTAAAATPRPTVGTTFDVDIGNLPFGIALLGMGFSDASYNGLPLPLPLDGLGMPNCTLWAAPEVLLPVTGSPTATWSLSIPAAPSLHGLPFFQQAFALDQAANALGITASNAAAGVLGV